MNDKGSAEDADDLAATLRSFSNEQLAPLYALLDEPISSTLAVEERVKAAHPNHLAYVDLMAQHLRLFGGNTIINLGRGEGPPYREIVEDICGSRGIEVPAGATTLEMERRLLAHFFASIPEAERDVILAEAAERYGYAFDATNLSGLATAVATQAGGRAASLLLYRTGLQLTETVAALTIGRGVAVAGNQVLARALGFAAGPVGWAVSGALALKDLASRAMRVTTPCVVIIAATRQVVLWRDDLEPGA